MRTTPSTEPTAPRWRPSDSVPGANTSTKLIAVSRQGFAPRGVLDVELEPKDIISAYRKWDAA